MGNIGPTELIIVLVIVLLIFGPKRLPSLGRQLGSGMREFKDSITGRSGDASDDADADRPAALPAAPAATGAPEAPAEAGHVPAPPVASPTGEPGPEDRPRG